MHDLYNQLANVENALNRCSLKRQTNTATLGGLGFILLFGEETICRQKTFISYRLIYLLRKLMLVLRL